MKNIVKILILLLCFVQYLFSTGIEPIKQDFKACYKKNINSFVKIKDRYAIAVSKHKILLYSKKHLKNYIKRDPFLGLYLFYSKKEHKPVDFKSFSLKAICKYKKIAVLNNKNYNLNEISNFGNGIDGFSILKKPVVPNSLIACVCCSNYGLSVGKNNFIDSDFILRFLKSKKIRYADSGLRFYQKNNNIFVKYKNPFFKHIYLHKNDEIISINNKKFENLNQLDKYILFLPIGSKIIVKYKRGKNIYAQIIKLKKRVSSEILGETFLETLGLYLKYNLKVSYVMKNSLMYKLGIKKGDKLLKINNYFIKSRKSIKKILTTMKRNRIYLLFSRNHFQFFVNFRR